MLRRMGAEIVKVEGPAGGDVVRYMSPRVGPTSAMFEALNGGKRGVVIDLKHGAGPGVLKRMAAHADVVVEGFRPGVMDRLGVGYESLRAANEALVYCSISGYGQDGPHARKAGHDLNYLALAGVLGQAGPAGPGLASPMPVQVADVAGGAMNAVIGIVAALFDAQRSGRGRWVDVSMAEGSLQFLLPALADHFAGSTPQRGAGLLTGGAACYRVYRTRDDRELSVASLEPQFWAAMCAALNRPDLAGRQGEAMQAGSPVHQELEAIFATQSLAEWTATFADFDACIEPLLTFDEVVSHAQHRARGVFVGDPDRPEGTQLAAIGPRFDGSPMEALPPSPAPGEHTAAVLADFGFDEDEIAALGAEGALGVSA